MKIKIGGFDLQIADFDIEFDELKIKFADSNIKIARMHIENTYGCIFLMFLHAIPVAAAFCSEAILVIKRVLVLGTDFLFYLFGFLF